MALEEEAPKRVRARAVAAVTWAGRVAFVLATFVAGGWAVAVVLSLASSLYGGEGVSGEGATLLSTVGGVLAGAVATYLGNSSSRDPDTRTRRTDPPTAEEQRQAGQEDFLPEQLP